MSFRRSLLTNHRSVWKLFSRGLLVLVVSFSVELPPAVAQQVQTREEGEMRRFYPDDPLWQDPDRLDIPAMKPFNLRKDYDFVQNTFSDLGLIRFRGHVPKGGYDVQNGINEGRETGATTVQ